MELKDHQVIWKMRKHSHNADLFVSLHSCANNNHTEGKTIFGQQS